MKNATRLFTMLFCTLIFAVPNLFAAYPDRPITYQIPFNPGGQSDVEARRQQPRLEKILGEKVIVQYKPGGGGSIGWAKMVKQRPNGYFMSGINIPHIILQPLARGNAGYKTEQLVPVALFQATPIGLAVMKDSQFKSLSDLVAYAKKHKGAVTCAGSGTWSGHHIAYLQFQKAAGVKLTYVPYKGASPSVAAFLGRHVAALWANSNDLFQHRDKIRVLAFGTEKPFPPMPAVPTFKDQGYNILASIDRGVGVPPKTPKNIIKTLEKAFLSISRNPQVKQQMLDAGFVPLEMDAAEATAYIRSKVVEWAPVVKEFKK
ncbi:MAG: tripartite tricarboxylate transporter substrate binding protein [Deltaproteobacteria bacterium]|jgi:tripartite-type tricarboxylate transporter receptor subunit TctC|nr:tripartite tricarboxylate transporter substrate binding protein [Deltaproteobacteria bacterium]MBT4644611.1 tripartite tricarboxylate transporter substrate binding protein [Deltaproteobacteria bacterium]MBT7712764.1 tripartite tricarboxylate transporter substrate binding protein [Deltaproteobacteria bacterium]